MNITSKIAKRYIYPNGKINFISIITLISFIGITIGVAAVIIVMSIFKGFQELHKEQIVNLDPHIRVQPNTGKWFAENINTLELVKILEKEKYINEVAVNSTSKIVLFANGIIQPAILNSYLDTNIQIFNHLKSKKVIGNFTIRNHSTIQSDKDIPRVIFGVNLASKLNIRIGDTITIMTSEMIEKAILYLNTNTGIKTLVTGLYHTNIENYDNMTIITDDKLIRELYDGNYKPNSIDIRFKESKMIDDIDSYKEEIYTILSKSKILVTQNEEAADSKEINNLIKVLSWYDLNIDIFRIMKFERFASFTIVGLIILIASFNIFASLGMSVVEKQRDISILKVLGADQKMISNIFIKSGLAIGISSSLLGSIIGVGFCLLNIKYKILAINGTAFIIDHIPMKIMYDEVIFVICLSIFFSYIAALIPSKRANEINIISKLKNE